MTTATIDAATFSISCRCGWFHQGAEAVTVRKDAEFIADRHERGVRRTYQHETLVAEEV